MAWVTVRQATELTGKARSSLYRDMAKGRVSYRTEADGGRVVDTSELIRVYGELRLIETHDRDGLRLPDETEKTVSEALIAEIKALREEVAGLRQEMQAMRLLEHKTETAETPRRWWQWGSADALRLSNRRRPRNELRPVTRYQRTEWGFWRWPTTARTRIFCAGSFTS
jgi:hypothetical protein